MNVSEPDGTRYERGLARMKQIGGAHATEEFLAALADTAPELGRYVAEFIYGDLYERVGLGLKGRQLATIATLVALGGCERQLALHIKVALNLGIRAGTLTEPLHPSERVRGLSPCPERCGGSARCPCGTRRRHRSAVNALRQR